MTNHLDYNTNTMSHVATKKSFSSAKAWSMKFTRCCGAETCEQNLLQSESLKACVQDSKSCTLQDLSAWIVEKVLHKAVHILRNLESLNISVKSRVSWLSANASAESIFSAIWRMQSRLRARCEVIGYKSPEGLFSSPSIL